MKKSIFWLILGIVATLVLSQNAYAEEWLPIDEISAEDIMVIVNATNELKWANKIPDNAVEFARLPGNVIAVLFEDGSLAIYGSGGEKTMLPDQHRSLDLQESNKNLILTDNKSQNQEDRLLELERSFITTWNATVKSPDLITLEELKRADSIMSEIFEILSNGPQASKGNFVMMAARRGNRYKSLVETELPFLSPEVLFTFYT